MKKIIVWLAGVSLALGAWAYSTEIVGGIAWKYTTTTVWMGEEQQTVAIVGADEDTTPAVPTSATSLTVPKKLGGYSVYKIGAYAFNGCSSLQSLSIPTNVTQIAYSAFQDCSAVTTLSIGAETRLVADSYTVSSIADSFPDLASLTIAGDASRVAYRMYAGCENVKNVSYSGTAKLQTLLPDSCAIVESVILPDATTSICDDAFAGCDALSYIRFPEGWVFRSADLTRMGVSDSYIERFTTSDHNWIVMGTTLIKYIGDENVTALTIPDGVDIIDDEALAELYNLQTVTFAGSERIIGKKAFYNCTDLEYVDLPETVESIEQSAFENCTWIDEVYFPTELKSIGAYAFKNCTELLACSFYEGLGEIKDYAFQNCWRMLSASIPYSVTNLGYSVFSGCDSIVGVVVPSNLRTLSDIFPAAYTQIEQVIIPDGETEIMASMFGYCTALNTIEIPNTVTNIGNSAFRSCTSLKSQSLPDSVIELGAYAFYNCSALETVALSKNMISLKERTFEECDLLTSIIIPASVRTLGSSVFRCTDLPIPDTAIRDVYFLGDAPQYASDAYSGTSLSLITHVVKDTRGWDGNSTSKSLPKTWLSRSITYWTPNRFEVTFDPNGGSFEPYKAEQITGTTYALPDVKPTRSGYIFAGWWTQPEGGGEVISTTVVHATRSHTLYAHWETSYTVEILFNPNGGTVSPDSGTYTAGATHVRFPVPTRRGYSFAGWWTGATDGEQITESDHVPLVSATLYAHWTPITYTVEFRSNNGQSQVASQTFIFDVPGNLQANTFTLAGRNFIGWALSSGGTVAYTDGDSVLNWCETQGDKVILYAKWDGARYAVRFDENGGSGEMANQTILVNSTKALNANKFTRTGYTFQGWALTPNGAVVYANQANVNNLALDDGNITLYAKWKANTYVVRYHYNYGNSTVTKNQSFTWDVSQRLSYVNGGLGWKNPTCCSFLGWGTAANTDFAKYGNAELVRNLASTQGAVVHLYAIWMGSGQYAIRFHRNDGGVDTVVQQRYAVNERKHLVWKDSQIGWSRVGYTFLGWAKSSRATTPNYQNGEVVENLAAAGKTLELYAVWKPEQVPYKVRFHKNYGDNATHDTAFVFGKRQSLPWLDSQLKWTRSGYIFVGWGSSANSSVGLYANGESVLDLATVKNGVVHLYAIWALAKDNYILKLYRQINSSDTVSVMVRMPKDASTRIPWKDSQLGWNLQNTTFMGWSTAANTRIVQYENGEQVKNLAAAGKTVSLYAVWRPMNTYVVRFHRVSNATDATIASQWFYRGVSTRLAWQGSGLGWDMSGLTFYGWSRSKSSVAVAFTNGQSVKDIAAAGAILDLYAVWQYTITFNRNVGDGMTATRTYYVNQRAQIPWLDSELKFTHSDYVFLGWSFSRDGAVKYANGEKSANTVNIFNSGSILYAIWTTKKTSAVRGGIASTSTSTSTASTPTPNTYTYTPGYYRGAFADGSGTFDLLLDEFDDDGVATAYFVAATASGTWSVECEATVVGDELLIVLDGRTYAIVCDVDDGYKVKVIEN